MAKMAEETYLFVSDNSCPAGTEVIPDCKEACALVTLPAGIKQKNLAGIYKAAAYRLPVSILNKGNNGIGPGRVGQHKKIIIFGCVIYRIFKEI